MKRPAFSQTLSGLFLMFLMLFSLAATAARLEADRQDMAVGEITTVHLKGAPFIALVDWKVSSELEIIDSDSKRVRVRGARAGTGKVTCEMNLNAHTLEITVRGAAPPSVAPTPVPPMIQPPPAGTAQVYTAPSRPASGTAAPLSDLAGTWWINANGYQGKLELSSTQGMLIGRVWFDAHGVWEPLEEMYFDETIGELSFTRPGANQAYRGRLQGATLEGRFIQGSGGAYPTNAPAYSWSATRPGAVMAKPMVMSTTRPARIDEFTWQDMNEDKVGSHGDGRPNGTPDGRFRLVLDLPDRLAVTSISIWSAMENGAKGGGHIWHSKHGSYWVLGVFRDGRQLNASHIASLGEFSGKVVFDLYANFSGWFKPDQFVLVEVETGDGRVLSGKAKLTSQAGGGASLSLNRDRFAPGEAIVLDFTAPASYAANAWIGIIPSRVPHGSEAENDRHDLAYQYLQKRAAGSMTFTAPAATGNYDLRMHDTDDNGREVASISFQVGAAPLDGGRDYTARPPSAAPQPTPGGDDNLKDVVNQLKGLFGR